MAFREAQARRPVQASERQWRATGTRLAAAGSLVAVAVVAAVIVFGSSGGSTSHVPKASSRPSSGHAPATSRTGKPGTATVPILTYDVINVAPAQSAAPSALYVPADQFSSQMDALKANGWHAITLDQLRDYWTHGAPLGPGKPIVITFDRGYASQYTNALPVLKRLGWVGVENLQVSGLPPSDGGLTDAQVRGLIAAGWELATEGVSQTDLTVLGAAQLRNEVDTARQTLRSRYNVPVNWFSYPSGSYDATVSAAVRAAGFVGSTTVIPGWADAQGDRFRLPRLQVRGGTSASELLLQIASAEGNKQPPDAYHAPAAA